MDGLNTYFVSRAAHQAGLKVALSGLGSDEIFGGYSTFTIDPSGGVCGRTRTMDSWSTSAPERRYGRQDCRGRCGSQGRRGLAVAQRLSPRVLFHAPFVHTFPRATFAFTVLRAAGQRCTAQDSVWRQRMQETARQAARLDSFTSVSCFELQSYMVNTLLRDTDAVSMANSLEVRVPFLDHRLVEFVARLPKGAKYQAGSAEGVAGRSPVRCAAG